LAIIIFLFFFVLFGRVAWFAMQEQRWFKKLLFYYFPRYVQPLSKKHKLVNLYYNNLTTEERKAFEWRAYYFLNTTNIEFRGFSNLALINQNSVRYLIASVATQMSLFLTEDCFDAFNKIIIYPDNYYSKITQQYHQGETNPGAGLIVLSYPSFRKGFEFAHDGVNLLMHELAHALWLENMLFEYDIFDRQALDDYKVIAAIESLRMTQMDNYFLRTYALTNQEEFFAVAVENFFERPREFKAALPELYQTIAILLKQDTLKLQTI
jgi:MtfA peptidase